MNRFARVLGLPQLSAGCCGSSRRARAVLGPDFALAELHDRVLGNGSVALDVLAGEIERWLAAASE